MTVLGKEHRKQPPGSTAYCFTCGTLASASSSSTMFCTVHFKLRILILPAINQAAASRLSFTAAGALGPFAHRKASPIQLACPDTDTFPPMGLDQTPSRLPLSTDPSWRWRSDCGLPASCPACQSPPVNMQSIHTPPVKLTDLRASS